MDVIEELKFLGKKWGMGRGVGRRGVRGVGLVRGKGVC